MVELFVDTLLQFVDTYHIARETRHPGQTLWLSVAIDEYPGSRTPISETRQVPVVLTLVNHEDIADLRKGVTWSNILQRTVVRAAHEASAQGGLLTTSDLSVVFHHRHRRVAELIRQHDVETG